MGFLYLTLGFGFYTPLTTSGTDLLDWSDTNVRGILRPLDGLWIHTDIVPSVSEHLGPNHSHLGWLLLPFGKKKNCEGKQGLRLTSNISFCCDWVQGRQK